MLNSVTLVGRAGKDPNVKTFNSGSKLAEVNMAITRPVKGEKPATDWITVKIWGQAADAAESYLKKGHLFGVIGELQEEHWEDNGNKRSKHVVHATRFRLMEPKAKKSPSEESPNEHDIFGGYGG